MESGNQTTIREKSAGSSKHESSIPAKKRTFEKELVPGSLQTPSRKPETRTQSRGYSRRSRIL